jgi:hypothetical protein
MQITVDPTAGWHGASGDALRTAGPEVSPTFGPAWVANCYGSTHKKRRKALREAGVEHDPADRDAVARAYWHLTEGAS